ncbi:MAG: hypothetical protein R3F11_01200 [Verrucomicrobiales bacterium]
MTMTSCPRTRLLAVLPPSRGGCLGGGGFRPNIVFIIADPSARRSEPTATRFGTPNLDRLAAEGMLFQDATTWARGSARCALPRAP